MKKAILTSFILSLSFANLSAQQNSENGYGLPVHTPVTPIKVMFVFAEEIATPPCVLGPQPNWAPGSLPSNVNTYFDAFVPIGGPTSYITKYYYDASFGQFI